MMPDLKVWGTTTGPRGKLTIYVNPDLDEDSPRGTTTWACTDWKAGRCWVELAPHALKDKRLAGWLLHEFVHVIEYFNDECYLSVTRVDECTALAQTMEKQLWPMLRDLKVCKGANPFRGAGR